MPENPRIEELRRRVQADPASIAFAALAEEYRRLGRCEEAVETCLAGLQRHPAYLSARVTLGRALIETGAFDQAREQFETVLRSAPENIAATRGLSQIHERLGHSDQMDPHLAQLMREHLEAAAAAPPPRRKQEPEPVEVFEPADSFGPESLDLRDLAEPLNPAFDLAFAPLSDEPSIELDLPELPVSADVSAISTLERFLAAIQHARHA